MKSVSELEAKLAETRQRVRNLTVIGLRPELTPQMRAAVHECERLGRIEVKLRWKVLELERRRVLERGRVRALELLSHPDPAVREPAKRALDHADVALGLLEADKRKAPPGRRAERWENASSHTEPYQSAASSPGEVLRIRRILRLISFVGFPNQFPAQRLIPPR